MQGNLMGHTNLVDSLVEKKNGGSNMVTKQQKQCFFLNFNLEL